MAAAAVLLLLAAFAGSVVVFSPSRSATADPLRAAADATEAAGTAHWHIEFDTRVDGGAAGQARISTVAEGTVRFPDRSATHYSISSVGSGRFVGPADTLETLNVGSHKLLRHPAGTGKWVRYTGEFNMAAAISRPDATLNLLRSADNNPVDLGPSTIGGIAVHGYRFHALPGMFDMPFPPPEGATSPEHIVSVWIDDHRHLLQRLTVEVSGTSDDPTQLTYQTTLTATLTDHGAPVDIVLPNPDQIAGT